MNVLVIGNGFDLAHDLPTKYEHFLKFTQAYEKYKPICKPGQSVKDEWEAAPEEEKGLLVYFANLCDQKKALFEEIGNMIEKNVWLKYFVSIYESRKEAGKDGWIDFESEISQVIQALDAAKLTVEEQTRQGKEKAKLEQWQLNILSPFIADDGTILKSDSIFFTMKAIAYRKWKFLDSLNKLTRCLEIYLSDFVGGILLEKTLPDIQGLPIINKVLSFNYTDTYEKLYTRNPYIEYDYIHGKASIENTMDTNNMVLGIDEYLKGDTKNENIEFIEFKKYFQRIHKETGCLYRTWLDKMEKMDSGNIKELTSIKINEDGTVTSTEEYVGYHRLFFYGHSLDVTDKDIIRDLVLADKVQTTIFYMNRADYARKITNLVKIIGQDELIKRTGGKERTIVFVKIANRE